MARAIRSDNAHPHAFSAADLAEFTAVLAEPGRAHATVGIYREFVRRELGALLRGRYDDVPLRVPTLIIHGTRDRVIARRSIEHAARPGDPLEIALVPDSGHFIADERPDLVAQRALAFFAAG